jgi:hypothetical protein
MLCTVCGETSGSRAYFQLRCAENMPHQMNRNKGGYITLKTSDDILDVLRMCADSRAKADVSLYSLHRVHVAVTNCGCSVNISILGVCLVRCGCCDKTCMSTCHCRNVRLQIEAPTLHSWIN